MIFGKYVNRYYAKYWYYFLIGFLSLIAVDVVQLFVPEIIGEIIGKLSNYLIQQQGGIVDGAVWGGTENFMHVNDYVYYFTVLALIVFAIGLFRYLWRITLNLTQVRIERDLRREMFYHVETLSASFYNMQKTGGLMAYFTNDIESVSITFSDGIIFMCDVVFLGTLALIKMLMLNYVLALLCAAPMIFFACIGYYVEKGADARYEKRQESFEKLSDMVQENLSGITVIKAFVKEVSEMRKFARLNKYTKNCNLTYLKYSIKVDVLVNALVYSSFFILIALGGSIILAPQINISFGLEKMDIDSLTTFYGYYESLIWPMIAVGMLINIVSRGRASLRRITYLMDQKSEINDQPYQHVKEFKGEIEFKNLDFKYPDEKSDLLALEHINVTIHAGENVGIIGKTGSGKSTFVNTLLKLYNVDRGMIYIDGKDINDWSSKDLRDHIGYVAQDTFLFSDFIDSNIAFYNPNLSEDEIKQAARFACVDDNISEFSLGYKTKVGERGVTLSGGQKQRISMARAVIKNPEILILDDSVSAVDSNTEKEILNNINTYRKGKTTFIIAHRISAVENLDKIIVLDNGRIVGCGKHDELVETCPLYAKICKLQSFEKEVENNG